MTPGTLIQFTIYERPRDYPEGYVVRCWEITAGEMIPGEAWGAPTLEAARELVPEGLFCIPRDPDDDAVIVETWT
jgi:hypothetical protein